MCLVRCDKESAYQNLEAIKDFEFEFETGNLMMISCIVFNKCLYYVIFRFSLS